MNYKKTSKSVEFAATDKEAREIENAANSFLEKNGGGIVVNKVRMVTVGSPVVPESGEYSFTLHLDYDKCQDGTGMRISIVICSYEEMQSSIWRLDDCLKRKGRSLTDYKYRLFIDNRCDGEVKSVILAFHQPEKRAAS